MKEFIEKLIGRLEEEKKEAQRDGSFSFAMGFKVAISIVNELAEEYKGGCCEWNFKKSIADGGYFYSSGCNHKRFSDLHSFEFCPYCGKKIKVVE